MKESQENGKKIFVLQPCNFTGSYTIILKFSAILNVELKIFIKFSNYQECFLQFV